MDEYQLKRMYEKGLALLKEVNKLLETQCNLLKEQNDILRQMAGVEPRKENENGRIQ